MGVCRGEYLPRGCQSGTVSAQGVSAQGGCLPSRGVYPVGFTPPDQRQTPPHPVNRMTDTHV